MVGRCFLNDRPARPLGLAIKLRIAVDNTPEDEEPEFNDERAMLAVLDDVDRLAGFTEPRRVWGTS